MYVAGAVILATLVIGIVAGIGVGVWYFRKKQGIARFNRLDLLVENDQLNFEEKE